MRRCSRGFRARAISPGANLPLFLAAGCLLAIGLHRAFARPERYRGKVSGGILGGLSLALFGLFCWGTFYAARDLPRAETAPRAGQRAAEFTLAGLDGKLMQLLGHKDIRMTLRYVQITQLDLQREFHAARRKAAQAYAVPTRSLPAASITAGLTGICQALATTRHLLEMYRRELSEEKTSRKLRRLDHRLLATAIEVQKLAAGEK